MIGLNIRTAALGVVAVVLAGASTQVDWRVPGERARKRAAMAGASGADSVWPFERGVYIPVTGVPVIRDTLEMSVVAAGRARPRARASLVAGVEGRVDRVEVREGEDVRAGAVIARIDAERHELELARQRARRDRARAEFLERTLFDTANADPELRRRRETAARVRSGLVEAEIGVREAELALRRATVRAPFSGRVANLAVVAGQRVEARASICEIVDISRLRIEVPALETDVPELAEGRRARIRFIAFPDTAMEGRVVSVNPVVDPRTRSARVVVAMSNPDGAVKPGMYARVRIAGRLYPDRVLVPREAILERSGRTLVFVFAPDAPGSARGRARWAYVAGGLENRTHVELVDAVGATIPEPGQVVLTGGHYALVHDARVQLIDADPRDAPASP